MMPAGVHVTGRRRDGDERDDPGDPDPATLRNHVRSSPVNVDRVRRRPPRTTVEEKARFDPQR
jgi:hypothetical protein